MARAASNKGSPALGALLQGAEYLPAPVEIVYNGASCRALGSCTASAANIMVMCGCSACAARPVAELLTNGGRVMSLQEWCLHSSLPGGASLERLSIRQAGTGYTVPLPLWLRAASCLMGGEGLKRKQLSVFWWDSPPDGPVPTVPPLPCQRQPAPPPPSGAWRAATVVGFDASTGIYTLKYHTDTKKHVRHIYLPLALLHFARTPPPPGTAPRNVAEGCLPLPAVLLPLLPPEGLAPSPAVVAATAAAASAAAPAAAAAAAQQPSATHPVQVQELQTQQRQMMLLMQHQQQQELEKLIMLRQQQQEVQLQLQQQQQQQQQQQRQAQQLICNRADYQYQQQQQHLQQQQQQQQQLLLMRMQMQQGQQVQQLQLQQQQQQQITLAQMQQQQQPPQLQQQQPPQLDLVPLQLQQQHQYACSPHQEAEDRSRKRKEAQGCCDSADSSPSKPSSFNTSSPRAAPSPITASFPASKDASPTTTLSPFSPLPEQTASTNGNAMGVVPRLGLFRLPPLPGAPAVLPPLLPGSASVSMGWEGALGVAGGSGSAGTGVGSVALMPYRMGSSSRTGEPPCGDLPPALRPQQQQSPYQQQQQQSPYQQQRQQRQQQPHQSPYLQQQQQQQQGPQLAAFDSCVRAEASSHAAPGPLGRTEAMDAFLSGGIRGPLLPTMKSTTGCSSSPASTFTAASMPQQPQQQAAAGMGHGTAADAGVRPLRESSGSVSGAGYGGGGASYGGGGGAAAGAVGNRTLGFATSDEKEVEDMFRVLEASPWSIQAAMGRDPASFGPIHKSARPTVSVAAAAQASNSPASAYLPPPCPSFPAPAPQPLLPQPPQPLLLQLHSQPSQPLVTAATALGGDCSEANAAQHGRQQQSFSPPLKRPRVAQPQRGDEVQRSCAVPSLLAKHAPMSASALQLAGSCAAGRQQASWDWDLLLRDAKLCDTSGSFNAGA